MTQNDERFGGRDVLVAHALGGPDIFGDGLEVVYGASELCPHEEFYFLITWSSFDAGEQATLPFLQRC